MSAALTVRPSTESARVTDTQDNDTTGGPGPRRRRLAARRGRSGRTRGSALSRPGHRVVDDTDGGAIVLTLLMAIPVAGVLPAEVVAEKENVAARHRPGDAVRAHSRLGTAGRRPDRVRRPRRSRRAVPPDGRHLLRHGHRTDAVGAVVVRSVATIQRSSSSPARRSSASRRQQQRRTFALESMRTSEQVAQFVALQRVGFDVEVQLGDVLIEAMVCLVGNEAGTECVTWSPSDDVLDPGDRILEVDGEPVDGVEDLGRILAGRPARRSGRDADRPSRAWASSSSTSNSPRSPTIRIERSSGSIRSTRAGSSCRSSSTSIPARSGVRRPVWPSR